MSKRLALIAVCLGYFMTILDSTVVNVALQSMQQHLGTNVNGIQWVVVGYTLAFASLLLSGGTLGERFGNKRMYVIGLSVFSVCSLLCGLAPNLITLVVARIAQGVGAALLVPVTLGLLSELFTDAKAHARAVGTWGGMGGIGAAAGPIVGGALVSSLGWRSIFLINVPVGLLAAYLSIRALPARPAARQTRLDPLGQATSILGFGAVTFALLQARTLGIGSPVILGTAAAGLICLGGFVWIERRSAAPMVPLRFFRNVSFSAANLVGFLINFGNYGWLFIISLYLQQQRHFSPAITGLVILPWGVSILISAIYGGKATAAAGPRKPMLLGLSVGVIALIVQVAIGAGTPLQWLILPLLAFGFGMAYTMPAMTVAVVSHAPKERASTSSGIVNTSRQLGSSFGVAILGGLVTAMSFMSGFKVGILIAAGAYLIGFICTWLGVRNAVS